MGNKIAEESEYSIVVDTEKTCKIYLSSVTKANEQNLNFKMFMGLV